MDKVNGGDEYVFAYAAEHPPEEWREAYSAEAIRVLHQRLDGYGVRRELEDAQEGAVRYLTVVGRIQELVLARDVLARVCADLERVLDTDWADTLAWILENAPRDGVLHPLDVPVNDWPQLSALKRSLLNAAVLLTRNPKKTGA